MSPPVFKLNDLNLNKYKSNLRIHGVEFKICICCTIALHRTKVTCALFHESETVMYIKNVPNFLIT